MTGTLTRVDCKGKQLQLSVKDVTTGDHQSPAGARFFRIPDPGRYRHFALRRAKAAPRQGGLQAFACRPANPKGANGIR